MKKITSENIFDQIKLNINSDIRNAAAIIEISPEKRNMESYKQYLEDMMSIIQVLDTSPWNDMFLQILQSAINERLRLEK